MLIARVVGNVWGTKKAETLEGYRLLLVRPLAARRADEDTGETKDLPGELEIDADHQRLALSHETLVAVDRLGAGPGELVLVAHGSRCRDLTLGPAVATKELVVAIVDRARVRV